MATEMVERVTNILMLEFESSVDEYYPANAKHEIRPTMENVARQIISAMREPTEAMKLAGNYPTDEAGSCWYSMIDEALRND